MIQLTKRESEVMNLVASGLNNQEISDQLCISNHTTKAHISSIYRKLGIKNRVLVAKHRFAAELQDNDKNKKSSD